MQETIYKMNTPVSIALLADLHERPVGPAFVSLRARRPDIICIAGDMLYGSPSGNGDLVAERIVPVLKTCVTIAPTFLSLGNHEWILCQEDMELLRSTGAHVLDNCWEEWHGILIGGLTSATVINYRQYRSTTHEKYPKRPSSVGEKPKSSMTWIRDFCKQTGFKILLCHHPEYYPRYLANFPIDLVLSGHAHGGQWRIFHQGVFAPGQGWFPKLTSGVHGHLVISRGLANTAPVPRFFNPTEIVYIEPEGAGRDRKMG